MVEELNQDAERAAPPSNASAAPGERRRDGALVAELILASGAVSALSIVSLMSWWHNEMRVASWTGAGALIVLAWMTGRVIALGRREDPHERTQSAAAEAPPDAKAAVES